MQRAKGPPQSGLRSRALAAVLWFLQEFTYRGRTVVVAALLLSSLSFGGMLAWRKWSPTIAKQDKYLVRVDRVHLSPPPAWLQMDIAAEALEDAGLAGGLSVLDADLVPRLAEALELHPWIRRVRRVEKRFPASVQAEVEYRVPLATVEAGNGAPDNTLGLSPVDEHAVRLPAADLPRDMLLRLPRIADMGPLPLTGQPFEGPKIMGAIALVRYLRDEWDALHLVAVQPLDRPEIRSDDKYYLYDLITEGGTLIHWGAAPDAAPHDEVPADVKLARLRAFVNQHGPLDTVDSPRVINIRHDLEVTPRVADRHAAEAPQGDDVDGL